MRNSGCKLCCRFARWLGGILLVLLVSAMGSMANADIGNTGWAKAPKAKESRGQRHLQVPVSMGIGKVPEYPMCGSKYKGYVVVQVDGEASYSPWPPSTTGGTALVPMLRIALAANYRMGEISAEDRFSLMTRAGIDLALRPHGSSILPLVGVAGGALIDPQHGIVGFDQTVRPLISFRGGVIVGFAALPGDIRLLYEYTSVIGGRTPWDCDGISEEKSIAISMFTVSFVF
jgi:hypothetical protein